MEIREATSDDLEAFLTLLLDMERHYEGQLAVDQANARERVTAALSEDHHGVILLALDPAVVGFVSLYPMFPGHDLKMAWFIKELYVMGGGRSRGVGEQLMRAAARTVLEHGGQRIDLTADIRNDGAQRFYDRLGATSTPKVFYRFKGDDLERLASDDGAVSR